MHVDAFVDSLSDAGSIPAASTIFILRLGYAGLHSRANSLQIQTPQPLMISPFCRAVRSHYIALHPDYKSVQQICCIGAAQLGRVR